MIITLLLVCCVVCCTGYASDGWPAIGMYSAIITHPSANQQTNFKQGLQNVLIKVSGNPAIMTLPAIRQASTHVAQMIQSYHIITQTGVPALDTSTPQTALVIDYHPKAIAHILTLAGQPMWDAKRPTTLVWLSINNGSKQPSVVDASQSSTQPIADALEHVAQNRGLTLLLPTMDLQDQTLTQSNDADGLLSSNALQTLANRYHVRSVLAGSLTQVNQQWQAKWRYLLDSAPIDWQQPIASTYTVATNALNTVASTMVAQLALSNNTDAHTDLMIHIAGVSGLADYVTLDKCISHLPHMTQLSSVDLNDQSVTFAAHYNDSITHLQHALTQQCHLVFDNLLQAPVHVAPNQSQTASLPTMLLHHVGTPS